MAPDSQSNFSGFTNVLCVHCDQRADHPAKAKWGDQRQRKFFKTVMQA
jgi:hypothetical protein